MIHRVSERDPQAHIQFIHAHAAASLGGVVCGSIIVHGVAIVEGRIDRERALLIRREKGDGWWW